MLTNRTEIGDGINFCTIKTDKFKHSSLNISFCTKLTTENAVMNTLLVSVLTKCCERFPKMEDFNRELDRLYAASISSVVRKYGELHVASIEASVLRNKYIPDGEDVTAQTVELLLDTLLCPYLKDGAFDSDIVENEKKNLIDIINASANNKDSYAARRCGEVMCENEKYSVYVYGDVASVEAVTPQSLTEYYNNVILSSKFEIYYVGDYEEAALCELIANAFSNVKRAVSLEQPITKVKKKVCGEVKNVTEHQKITQSKLSLGFRLGRSLADRNYAAVELFRELYGGSPTSKLFMNVREKMSLCYYCQPIVESMKGIMIVASAIEAENKEKAQKEILAQLDEIKNGNFTDEEMQSAKDSLINRYNEIEDDAGSIINWYLQRGLFGFVDTPELACMAVKFLTKQQLVLAANEVNLDTVYFLTGEEGKDVK